MSFREKSTWISFVLSVLLAVGYLFPVVHADRGIDTLHYLLGLLLAFAALQLVLRLIVAWQAPKDARTPKDERERLIELKAARIGFYALVACELLALAGAHVHGNPWTGMQTVALAIIVAWSIKLGGQIAYYWRGR